MLPQLEDRFQELQEGRRALFAQVASLSPEVRRRPLRQGAWTPLQNLEHAMLVEREVLRWIRSGREPGAFSLRGRVAKVLMWAFFALRLRTTAPTPEVLPREQPDLEEVQSSWDDVRGDLVSFLETVRPQTLRQPVFRHPYAGAMHILEALRFLRLHLHHHRRQVAKARP